MAFRELSTPKRVTAWREGHGLSRFRTTPEANGNDTRNADVFHYAGHSQGPRC